MSARSASRKRSRVFTLYSVPGMRARPPASASRALATAASEPSSSAKAPRSSCAGEDTFALDAGAYSASTRTGSSLRPMVSSLRRASSAQKPGSTALCQASNLSVVASMVVVPRGWNEASTALTIRILVGEGAVWRKVGKN